MRKSTSGFTIIELLIVIVVIGILAVIVITSFSGAQAKAKNTSTISDLDNITKKLAIYRADDPRGESKYPQNNADMLLMGIRLSDPGKSIIYCGNLAGDDYALVARKYGSTETAGYMWKADGSRTENTTVYDTSHGPSYSAFCAYINPDYVIATSGVAFSVP